MNPLSAYVEVVERVEHNWLLYTVVYTIIEILRFFSTDLDAYNDAIWLLSHCPVGFPVSWISHDHTLHIATPVLYSSSTITYIV